MLKFECSDEAQLDMLRGSKAKSHQSFDKRSKSKDLKKVKSMHVQSDLRINLEKLKKRREEEHLMDSSSSFKSSEEMKDSPRPAPNLLKPDKG